MHYEIIIYWSEEDEAYVAEAPELPGCAADGKTYQKALAQAETVIDEWIEPPRNSDGLYLSHVGAFCSRSSRSQ